MEFEYELVIYNDEGTESLAVDTTWTILQESSGIGSYEYWGFKGYDRGEDYLVTDGVEWDKTKFSDEENTFIEKYINDNFNAVEDKVIAAFEKENEPDYDDDYTF